MRIRITILCLAVVVLAALAVGCATIATGSTQSLAVTSNIDSAEIFLDGVKIGTTPFSGTVKKNGKELKISKEGYRTETVVLSKNLEAIFWGNIILGGTIGSITDFASGAAYAYQPATYQIDLKADTQAAAQYRHELAVRKFSMLYIDEIAKDMSRGDGEYLATLLSFVNDGKDSGVEADAIRKALAHASGEPVAFGRAMVELI